MKIKELDKFSGVKSKKILSEKYLLRVTFHLLSHIIKSYNVQVQCIETRLAQLQYIHWHQCFHWALEFGYICAVPCQLSYKGLWKITELECSTCDNKFNRRDRLVYFALFMISSLWPRVLWCNVISRPAGSGDMWDCDAGQGQQPTTADHRQADGPLRL